MIAATVLDARSSVVLAALVITWLAVAGLVVIAGNLHVRLRRLEQDRARSGRPNAFARLLGERVDGRDGVLLFVAPACRACDALLEELTRSMWTTPLTVLSTGDVHDVPDGLPGSVSVVDDAGALASRLGITVTPFAVSVADGVIVDASPVAGVAALRHISRPTAIHGARDMPMEVTRHGT